MTLPLMIGVFLTFFIVGEETRQDIEVIDGEVVIHRNIEYCYTKHGQLCQETKEKLSRL